MSSFTLDDIRAAAEKKFGATIITVSDGTDCKLLNPVRLSKEKRAALLAKQSELNDKKDDENAPDVDQEEVLRECLRLVGETPLQTEKLIADLPDLAMLMAVFEAYTGSEEAGEASASAA